MKRGETGVTELQKLRYQYNYIEVQDKDLGSYCIRLRRFL